MSDKTKVVTLTVAVDVEVPIDTDANAITLEVDPGHILLDINGETVGHVIGYTTTDYYDPLENV